MLLAVATVGLLAECVFFHAVLPARSICRSLRQGASTATTGLTRQVSQQRDKANAVGNPFAAR